MPRHGHNDIVVSVNQRGWLTVFEEFLSYLRIDSKELKTDDKHGSALNMWGSQRLFLENICTGLDQGVRTFYCLKCRQAGISTISLAVDIFWLAMHPGLQGVLVVDNDENREKFRLILHRYVQSFPKGFFGSSFSIMKGKDNKTFTHFSNGSTLDYLVAGKRKKATLGESRAYNYVHATETANWGDPEGIASFQKTLAQKHPDRLFLWESTAKGYNHWHDMWADAGRDQITKRRFFIGWWSKELNSYSPKGPKPEPELYRLYGADEPTGTERDLINAVAQRYGKIISMNQLAWFRHEASDTSVSEASTQQNMPWIEEQAFVLSGYSFFATRLLQKDLSRIAGYDEYENNPVKFKGYRFWIGEDFFSSKMEQVESLDEVELRIWEEPSIHGDYVIGCDPAFGRNDNKDRHSITVCRCYADKLVQVAEWAVHNIDTRQAAWVLAYLAGAYRQCLVNIELTGGPGLAIMTELNNLRNQLRADMNNARVVALEWEDFLSNARWYIYHRPDSMSGAGYAYGTKTSRDMKFKVMNQVRDLLATDVLVLNSMPCVEEMLTVVQDGSELGAMGTNKDDRVFSLAYAVLAYIEWIRPRMISAGMTFEKAQRGEFDNDYADPGIVNKIVQNYFKTAEERAEEGEAPAKWLRDRGLA